MPFKRKSSVSFTQEQEDKRSFYKENPLDFFRECLMVRDRSGSGLVPLDPNHCQLALLQLVDNAKKFFENIGKPGTQINIIVLKPRKEGVSTLIEALGFHQCSFFPSTNALVMAHRKDGADNIATISRRFYQQFPKDKKEYTVPIVKEGSTIEWGSVDDTNWDSRFIIASASNESVARGFDFDFIHISEEAFFRSPDALSATKIAGQAAKYVFEESTANGKDPAFYPGWKSAYYLYELEDYFEKNGTTPLDWNGKIKFFWAWWQDPEYCLDISEAQEQQIQDSLTQKEQDLIDRFNLSMGQLAWRRYTIKTKCSDQKKMSPEEFFDQEYPSDPESVFVSTGTNIFNLKKIEELKQRNTEPYRHGFIKQATSPTSVQFFAITGNSTQSTLKMFRPPEKDRKYIISVQTKEENYKYSVISVWLRETDDRIEEVVHYQAKNNASELAFIALWLAEMYNHGYIINNADHSGVIVGQRVTKYGYPHIYRRMNEEMVGDTQDRDQFVPGIKFSTNNHLIVDQAAESFSLGYTVIKSIDTLEELEMFEKTDKGYETPEGYPDGSAKCFCLAVYAHRITAPPMVEFLKKEQKPMTKTELVWEHVRKIKSNATRLSKWSEGSNPRRRHR